MTYPILIIGMHRSGTSLIARVCEQFGLFIGADLDHNAESRHFYQLNKSVLGYAHAAWDAPENVRYLLQSTREKKVILDQLQTAGFGSYLPKSRFRQSQLPERWGWKDPRTTLTLPLWLKLYPTAKIIHVIRNGVDIALSLNKREQAKEPTPKPYFSIRCTQFHGAFSLWEEYLRFAEANLAEIDPASVLTIKYEDFLADPHPIAQNLATFCDIPYDKTAVPELNPNRAFAFRQTSAGLEKYEAVKKSNIMVKYGYATL